MQQERYAQKIPEALLRGYNLQLQRVLAGERGYAVRIVLALELILHRQGHNTHQSRQQNPRHNRTLLTNIIDIMQETLQSPSCTSHYTRKTGNYKMTMQGIMKKCFFSVLAFWLADGRLEQADCSLQGGGLQVAGGDGGCGRQGMPGWIIQVGSKKGGTKPPDPHALDLRRGEWYRRGGNTQEKK